MHALDDLMIHGCGLAARCRPSRIEAETPIVPRTVAAAVREEASVWLDEELPAEWKSRLIERAETVYAHNARFRRRLRGHGNRGRDWLWAFSRHWLSALVYRHRPDLHGCLPSAYSIGHPLAPSTSR